VLARHQTNAFVATKVSRRPLGRDSPAGELTLFTALHSICTCSALETVPPEVTPCHPAKRTPWPPRSPAYATAIRPGATRCGPVHVCHIRRGTGPGGPRSLQNCRRTSRFVVGSIPTPLRHASLIRHRRRLADPQVPRYNRWHPAAVVLQPGRVRTNLFLSQPHLPWPQLPFAPSEARFALPVSVDDRLSL
jgi:hypothetical protein